MTEWTGRNVKALMDRLRLDQNQFADLLNVSQGTVSRWVKGAEPKGDNLSKLAQLAGESIDEFIHRPLKVGRSSSSPAGDVPVIGFVGAGAAVYAIDDLPQGGSHYEVKRPPKVFGDVVALEVRGDSLLPQIEDGWAIFYTGEQTLLESEVLNKLCVVKLLDGRMLVKKILRGSAPQRYHLLSTNAPLIEDVEIEWAAPVISITPR